MSFAQRSTRWRALNSSGRDIEQCETDYFARELRKTITGGSARRTRAYAVGVYMYRSFESPHTLTSMRISMVLWGRVTVEVRTAVLSERAILTGKQVYLNYPAA